MDTMGQAMAASPVLDASEEAKEAAYDLIMGKGREVFDLSRKSRSCAISMDAIRSAKIALLADGWSRPACPM